MKWGEGLNFNMNFNIVIFEDGTFQRLTGFQSNPIPPHPIQSTLHKQGKPPQQLVWPETLC